MAASNMRMVPADPSQENHPIVDGAERPMSQQDVAECHGHEMHPQKFVRLVGCHESNADKHQAVDHR
jgi:hypothetical protein